MSRMFEQIDQKIETEEDELSCYTALMDEVMQDEKSSKISDKSGKSRTIETGWFGDSTEARDKRVNDTVQAVKDLAANGDKWYVIRSRLVAEFESGRDAATGDRNLRDMVARVNRELGAAGRITFEPLAGRLANLLAEGEGIKNPDAVLGFRVRHSGGTLGPIGVCFKTKR
jgi:hypothetical protein